MKKLLLIPIMLIYTLAMSGVNVYAHYCGKSLASWSLHSDGDGCGDSCDDNKQTPKKKHKCCHDEVVAIKLKADHHHQDVVQPSFLAVFYLPSKPVFFEYGNTALVLRKDHQVANKSNAPPGLWQQIPLYKLHSRITYYG